MSNEQGFCNSDVSLRSSLSYSDFILWSVLILLLSLLLVSHFARYLLYTLCYYYTRWIGGPYSVCSGSPFFLLCVECVWWGQLVFFGRPNWLEWIETQVEHLFSCYTNPHPLCTMSFLGHSMHSPIKNTRPNVKSSNNNTTIGQRKDNQLTTGIYFVNSQPLRVCAQCIWRVLRTRTATTINTLIYNDTVHSSYCLFEFRE